MLLFFLLAFDVSDEFRVRIGGEARRNGFRFDQSRSSDRRFDGGFDADPCWRPWANWWSNARAF